MNWSNVKLIFLREVRDQLRDRRTLFMILVLPMLLYPFVGISFFQLSQFMREHPTEVVIVGRDRLPTAPALFDEEDRFHATWAATANEAGEDANKLLNLRFDVPLDEARKLVQDGTVQAVLHFPDGFDALAVAGGMKTPIPEISFNSAKRKSQVTAARLKRVLLGWRQAIMFGELSRRGIEPAEIEPFALAETDVADESLRSAAFWSIVFPFLLLIWALTGAFYPAIDLCAGEKERGTLETLLASPAVRSEIVWGKLLTVMLFSVVTVSLNLMSVGLTGSFVLKSFQSSMPNLGSPPAIAYLWLFLTVIPVSSLFSALCLALAVFARSTKEGQYYLMPLFLITLPLVVLPMSPSFELNLGNSLIPLTGIVLVLRATIEGDYVLALRHLVPVAAVTGLCCMLAFRWAVDQFNKESVLFRESERLDLLLRIKYYLRHRQETPPVAAAVVCGLLILLIQFGFNFLLAGRVRNLALMTILPQLVAVLGPALLLTFVMSKRARKTLSLKLPQAWSVVAAGLLALAIHPLALEVNGLVQQLYPLPQETQEAYAQLFDTEMSFPLMLLAFAVAPAICEELAFRGFILSGFRRLGHKRLAILFTSILFGLAHFVLQQSIVACALGLVLGYLVVQTGSILPAMVFHFIHNGLLVTLSWLLKNGTPRLDGWEWFIVSSAEEGLRFQWPAVAFAAAITLGLLTYFRRLPYEKSAEETIQESIERQGISPAWR
ncbi:MAG: ABC transporter permease subunit [Pirellulales bacterium]|nr:ABC transporter permease subunit [Pirellulales bacterium]